MINFGVGMEIGFGVRATNRRKRFELGDEKILKEIFLASNLFGWIFGMLQFDCLNSIKVPSGYVFRNLVDLRIDFVEPIKRAMPANQENGGKIGRHRSGRGGLSKYSWGC